MRTSTKLKKKTIGLLHLLMLIFLLPMEGFAQSNTAVQLDFAKAKSQLLNAPLEGSQSAQKPAMIEVRLDEETLQLQVLESPIMSAEFAKTYPGIKTYAFVGADDPTIGGRITLTPDWLNIFLMSPKGIGVIRPADARQPDQYILESEFDQQLIDILPECEFGTQMDRFDELQRQYNNEQEALSQGRATFSNGATRRTYNLAIVCTGEYHNAYGGTVAAATAQATAAVNGIQAIYDRELAVRFNLLVPLVFTNPATDPFIPDNNGGAARTVQAANVIGNNFAQATYDVGHVFHDHDGLAATNPADDGWSTGGVASLGVICNNTGSGTGFRKGRGWSGTSGASGMAGFVRLAAHEFGHQFNADHSWNGSGNSCSGANYNAPTAYEIGSGTTIMSYRGICDAAHNIPASTGNADDYFHTHSLTQMVNYLNANGGCAATVATTNTPPVVDANPMGITYVVPVNTPFTLTGSGTDADGDQIFYCWEQYDIGGAATMGLIDAAAGANAAAPLFRSYPPTTSPSRTFPQGGLNTMAVFEPLPSVARTLTFRLTGRDFNANGGGIHCSMATVQVVDNNGMFRVTSQNTPTTWNPNIDPNAVITWDVAGTDMDPINCPEVNILLSLDGGATFPITLLSNTPNDASEVIDIPFVSGCQARIKVECSDNIFFDINDEDILLDPTGPTFTTLPSDRTAECHTVSNPPDLSNWLGLFGGASVMDNCDNIIALTTELLTIDDGCGATETRTYRFIATDDAGNSSFAEASYIIEDTTRPNFVPASLPPTTVSGDCADDVPPVAMVEATDLCNPNLDVDFNEVIQPGSCDDRFVLIRTWTASDGCGNTRTFTQTITISDDEAPMIMGGENAIVECDLNGAGNTDALLSWLNNNAGATATDNCSIITWSNDYDIANFMTVCGGAGYVDVIFTATDECGNASSITRRFTIEDNTNPVFTNCPRPLEIENAEFDHCEAYVNFSLPLATDNCGDATVTQIDGTGLSTGSRFPVGTTILIWRATDECGNTTDCSMKVVVNDYWQVPEISCPDDVTQDNDPWMCGAVVEDIDPTAFSDNCIDNTAIIYKIEDDMGDLLATGVEDASGYKFDVGTSTVTYKIQDQPLLLITEVSQYLGAPIGATSPVPAYFNPDPLACYLEVTHFGPASLDISCLVIERLPGSTGGGGFYSIPAGIVMAPGDVLTIHLGAGADSPANLYFNAGINAAAAGNSSGAPAGYTISFDGQIIDLVAVNNYIPVIGEGTQAAVQAGDWSGNIGSMTDKGSSYRINVYDSNAAADWVIASDCSPATIGSLNPELPVFPPNGTQTSLQTIAPNTASCNFTVTIEDAEDPYCGEYDYHTYNAATNLGIPGSIDNGNCFQSVIQVADDFTIGDVNVLNLNGQHGNVSNLQLSLIAPSGTEVLLFEGLCGASSDFDLSLDAESLTSVALAPCAPLGQGGSFAAMNDLRDFYGESSQGDWILQIQHLNFDPNNGQLDNWLLELAEILPYSQMDTIIDNDPGLCGAKFMWIHPRLIDNCREGSISVEYLSNDRINVPVGGPIVGGEPVMEFFEVGTTTVKYTLVDAAGNMAMCSFDVTVLDVEAPVAMCPKDITLNLDPGACDIIYDFPVMGEDNCEVVSATANPPSGSVFERGTTKVTITVEDAAGNKDSCMFNIIVVEYVPTSSAMFCNDLVQVSLDTTCQAEINADMILEGNNYGCYEDYIITVFSCDDPAACPPLATSPVVTYSEVGQTLAVMILDPDTGNSCWGLISIEDKFSPEIECPSDTLVSCNANLDPEFLGEVELLSCEPGGVTVDYDDEVIDNGQCNNPRAIVNRTWTVTDGQGNASVCTQVITIRPFDLAEIQFPKDTIMDCGKIAGDPNATSADRLGRPTIDGEEIQVGGFCMTSINVTNEVYDICPGSYEILRTWKVRNMCQPIGPNNPLVHVQLIKVLDTNGPQIDGLADITISSDVWRCGADWEMPDLLIEDDCSAVDNLDIITPVGQVVIRNGKYVIEGLTIGTHIITITASDLCNNTSEGRLRITVIDDVAPVAVCDEFTVVSLTSTSNEDDEHLGYSKVYAESFDDGSFDNCSDEIFFKVLRMDEYDSNDNNKFPETVPEGDWDAIDCDGVNGDDDLRRSPPFHPNYNKVQAYFDDYAKFCCNDIEEGPIVVVFRVFDIDPEPYTFGKVYPSLVPAGENPDDYNGVLPEAMAEGGALYGHYNDCMVEVTVQDKLPPYVVAPPNITVTCDFWFEFDADNPNDYTDAFDGIFGKVVTGDNAADPANRDSINLTDRVCPSHPRFAEFAPSSIFDDPCYDDQYDMFWGFDGYALDNCEVDLEQTIIPNLHCGTGSILRRWRAGDASGNWSNIATQRITIINCKEFYVPTSCWRFTAKDVGDCDLVNLGNGLEYRRKLIEWPCDVELTTCQVGANPDVFDPENLDVFFDQDRRPRMDDDNCSLMAATYFDTRYTFVDGACLKIFRDWTVIDWCLYEDFQAGIYAGEYEWTYTQVIKLLNQDGPEFDNCSQTTCGFGNPANPNAPQCVGEVTIDPGISDDCTELEELRIDYKFDYDNDGSFDELGYSSTYGNLYPFPNPDGLPVRRFDPADYAITGIYPVGTHRILWAAEDGCGNTNICEYLLTIEDCKPPTAYCLPGVSTIPMPLAAGGYIDIWASDFDLNSYDNCTDQKDLIFSFSDDINDRSIRRTCDDVTGNIEALTLYVWDKAGNYATCSISLALADCSAQTQYSIAGKIENEAGANLDDVLVTLGGYMTNAQLIEQGTYAFDYLPEEQNYTISPGKNSNPLNGVSTFDIVLISRHILGIESLDSPYKLVAADINNSGNITTFDLVELRKLILLIDTEFVSNTSWRFIDAHFAFPNPANPFETTFPEVMTVNNLSSHITDGDFVAVKVGDVNGSAIPNQLLSGDSRNAVGDLNFKLADQTLAVGEEYTLSFKADELSQVLGYQFTLNYDVEALDLLKVEAGDLENMTTANFGLLKGAITTSWNVRTATALAADATAFQVTFKAKRAAKLSDLISISSDYTRAEAYSTDGELLNVDLEYTEENIAASVEAFELFQNKPNPFKSETFIGFVLPEASTATLRIYDVSGRTLKQYEGDFAKGYNGISINRAELSGSGVLYYTLITANHQATRKMILLD